MAVRVSRRVVDLHFVEARCQRFNVGQALQDGPVLQASDSGGHKNAEMADVRVREVDNALPGLLEIIGVLVDGRNPSKRLVRWRDVVAVEAKMTMGFLIRLSPQCTPGKS